jgi:hypothetical protein
LLAVPCPGVQKAARFPAGVNGGPWKKRGTASRSIFATGFFVCVEGGTGMDVKALNRMMQRRFARRLASRMVPAGKIPKI